MENSSSQNYAGYNPSPPNSGTPPPPPEGNPPPYVPKLPGRFPKKITMIMLPILLVGIMVTLSQAKVRQIISGNAWYTASSASAQCTSLGTAVINFSFTNKESSRAMLVVARDSQTGLYSDLGKVLAGQSKTGKLNTTRTSLNSGYVSFKMAWADNTGSTDTVNAGYSSVPTCPKPSNTPTPRPTTRPSPTPTRPPNTTNTPTPRPTNTPTPRPTTRPSPTPTRPPNTTNTPVPTMTICPTPGTVKNVQIKCPYCTPSPSQN